MKKGLTLVARQKVWKLPKRRGVGGNTLNPPPGSASELGQPQEGLAKRSTGFLTQQRMVLTWLHVVVVQKWQRNVQKSVMHVQSCFAF